MRSKAGVVVLGLAFAITLAGDAAESSGRVSRFCSDDEFFVHLHL